MRCEYQLASAPFNALKDAWIRIGSRKLLGATHQHLSASQRLEPPRSAQEIDLPVRPDWHRPSDHERRT